MEYFMVVPTGSRLNIRREPFKEKGAFFVQRVTPKLPQAFTSRHPTCCSQFKIHKKEPSNPKELKICVRIGRPSF